LRKKERKKERKKKIISFRRDREKGKTTRYDSRTKMAQTKKRK
jgi:hypothetical protein